MAERRYCGHTAAEIRRILIGGTSATEKIMGELLDHLGEIEAAHDARVAELLVANNAEVERRRAAEALAREAKDVLERGISLMETVEAKTLVGDEGCLWPVELARELIDRIGRSI